MNDPYREVGQHLLEVRERAEAQSAPQNNEAMRLDAERMQLEDRLSGIRATLVWAEALGLWTAHAELLLVREELEVRLAELHNPPSKEKTQIL